LIQTISDAHAALMRFARDSFAPSPGLPRQILIGGDGGVGKTHSVIAFSPHAQLQAKADGRPWRLIYTVPEHVNLGPQISDRFTRAGLAVARLEGRGDPFNPSPRRKPRCRNLPAVGEAIRAGKPVREAVCGTHDGPQCPFFETCDYLADVRRAAAADVVVVVVAHSFIFERLPREVLHDVGWVVIDEDFTGQGDYIRNLTLETFAADALGRYPVLDKSSPDEAATRKLAWLHAALLRAIGKAPDGYLPAAALLAEGLTPDDCIEAARLNWRRNIDVPMTPATNLEARAEMARMAAINRQLPVIAAVWQGLRALLAEGERGAGRIALGTQDRRRGSWREITVHAQKYLATWIADLPIIMLGATTSTAGVRRFFPRTETRVPPHVAAPHARNRLILGGFGKTTLARRPKRLRQLRTWHEVHNLGRDQVVVTHLSAVSAFTDMAGTRTTHHGANAGDDSFRDTDALSVIGGSSARPEEVAALGQRAVGAEYPSRARSKRRLRC
jgi:hypothetical protein